jgi:hypothetical protein
VLLQKVDTVVPWAALVELIAPHYSEGRTGRPPFALETMLQVHFMQQWFSLSDPAMQEAFFDTPLYREFAQLDAFGKPPDENTILRFRHRLEKHKWPIRSWPAWCHPPVEPPLPLARAACASRASAPCRACRKRLRTSSLWRPKGLPRGRSDACKNRNIGGLSKGVSAEPQSGLLLPE